jgi:predicted nuclease of predicted toxin-antitoxin system
VKFRFFSDHCVPLSIARTLQQHGHEVISLRDHLPVNSPDPVVIAKAQELDAVLLSLNGDFSDIVAFPPAKYPGIVAIQLHNHPENIPAVMAIFTNFLEQQTDKNFFVAKLVIVEAHRIRFRS